MTCPAIRPNQGHCMGLDIESVAFSMLDFAR